MQHEEPRPTPEMEHLMYLRENPELNEQPLTSTLTWHKFDIEDKATWPMEAKNYLLARDGKIFTEHFHPSLAFAWPYPHYWAELPEYPQNHD